MRLSSLLFSSSLALFLLSLVAVAQPVLEVSATLPADGTSYPRPSTDAEVAAFRIAATGAAILVRNVRIAADGDGSDSVEVTGIKLYEDINANRRLDASDRVVLGGTGMYRQDDGRFPPPQGWTVADPMPFRRHEFGCAVLNGRIYIIGGNYKKATSSEIPPNIARRVHEYDPAARQWRERSLMPSARAEHKCVTLGGRIYAIGGAVSGTTLASMDSYDPTTDSWQAEPPMVKARRGFGCVALDGRIYALGGGDASIEVFDPALGHWVVDASMPYFQYAAAAAAAYGKIYAIGGWPQYGVVWEYDPQSRTWTQRRSMPSPLAGHACVTYGGLIYAIGGRDYTPNYEAVQVYDPVQDQWSRQAPLKVGRGLCAAVAAFGRIYVLGGWWGNLESTDSVEYYDFGLGLDRTLAPGGAVDYLLTYDFTGYPGSEAHFRASLVDFIAEATAPVEIVGTTAGPNITLAERGAPTLEVQQAALSAGDSFPRASTDAVVMAFTLTARNYPVRWDSLVLSCTGSGNEALEIAGVRLYRDADGGGELDEGDVLIAASTAAFSGDNGLFPPAGAWSKVAPLIQARSGPCCAAYGGKVYTFGGYNSTVNYNTVEAYEPGLDRWTMLPARMPTARYNARCASTDGTIYVVGGLIIGGAPMEAYDPRFDRWTVLPAMPRARGGFGLSAWQGKLYATGGYYLPLDVYDPVAGQWQSQAAVPFNRDNFQSLVLGDTMYVFGGSSGSTPENVQAYDLKNPHWENRGKMLHYGWSMGAVAYLGRGYLLGIAQNYVNMEKMDEYDPETDRWRALPSLPTQRHHLGVAELNGKIYAVGGGTYRPDYLHDVEVYDPGLPVGESLALDESRAYLLVYDFSGRPGEKVDFHTTLAGFAATCTGTLQVVGAPNGPRVELQARPAIMEVATQAPAETIWPRRPGARTALIIDATAAGFYDPLVLTTMVFASMGTALEHLDLDQARLYRDGDGDGVWSAGDVPFGAPVRFATDDGTLRFDDTLTLSPGTAARFFLTWEMLGRPGPEATFYPSVADMQVHPAAYPDARAKIVGRTEGVELTLLAQSANATVTQVGGRPQEAPPASPGDQVLLAFDLLVSPEYDQVLRSLSFDCPVLQGTGTAQVALHCWLDQDSSGDWSLGDMRFGVDQAPGSSVVLMDRLPLSAGSSNRIFLAATLYGGSDAEATLQATLAAVDLRVVDYPVPVTGQAAGAPVELAYFSAAPQLQVVQGSLPAGTDFLRGERGVVVMSATLTALTQDLALQSLTFTSTGSGNEAQDIDNARLYHDVNGNGRLDAADALLLEATQRFLYDDSYISWPPRWLQAASLSLPRNNFASAICAGRLYAMGGPAAVDIHQPTDSLDLALPAGEGLPLLLVYDFPLGASGPGTYQSSLHVETRCSAYPQRVVVQSEYGNGTTIYLDSLWLKSPSHPRADQWYSRGTLEFNWETRLPAAGYYFRLDGNSSGSLTAQDAHTSATSVSLPRLDDGQRYFHLARMIPGGTEVDSTDVHHLLTRTDTSAQYPTLTTGIPLLAQGAEIAWSNLPAWHVGVRHPSDLSGVAGFRYRLDAVPETWPGAGAEWKPRNPANPQWTYWNVRPSNEGRQWFHLATVDNVGNQSAPRHMPVGVDFAPPAPVQDARALAVSGGRLLVEWSAAEDTVSGVNQYEVFRSPLAGTTGEKFAEVAVPRWLDAGPGGAGYASGQQWYYTVVPRDYAGNRQTAGNLQVRGIVDPESGVVPLQLLPLPDVQALEEQPQDAFDLADYVQPASAGVVFAIVADSDPRNGATLALGTRVRVHGVKDYAGVSRVTVRASDGVATDYGSFTVSIDDANDPPVITGFPALLAFGAVGDCTTLVLYDRVTDPDDARDSLIWSATGEGLALLESTWPSHGAPCWVRLDAIAAGYGTITFQVVDGSGEAATAAVCIRVGPPLPGDTNSDGQVDARDTLFFAQHWQTTGATPEATCDVAPDGVIDAADLMRLLESWGAHGKE